MRRFAVLWAVLACSAALQGQSTPSLTAGWYNGDCHSSGIGGWSNWYQSNQNFTRVYDAFHVPAGGWMVAAVFSNNLLYGNLPPITQAAWEIRTPIENGGGTVVASGVSAATQAYDAGQRAYRIEVDGLHVPLAQGDYALSVVPAGTAFGQSYVCETQGQSAVGTPPGNGTAFYSSQSGAFAWLSASDGKTNLNFSQGVLISGTAGSQTPLSRDDQWRANVDSLSQQMPAQHMLPFAGISLTDFLNQAAILKSRIPVMSDAEVRTGLEALVASIEDPHTDVEWPYPTGFRMLPLSLYWFDDGIYVTGASADHQDLLGAKLLAVGQTGIDAATRTLTALVPHENDQWPKHRIPLKELVNADFLFGMGLIGGTTTVPLQFQTGSKVSAPVLETFQDYQVPAIIPLLKGSLPPSSLPLYQQHTDRNYWATVIDNGATIYFQYNSCMEDSKQPSADFFKQLDQMMAQPGVQRIVLDMRNNSGGFTSILSPWIDEIQASRFNQRGRLYVIVGRATFSAAMEATNHLHDRTAALFVGEPTGAKPQFELRRGDFALPYFGIRVSYSNGVEGASDPGPTLIPDICAGLTFQDYINGADPALNAILSIPMRPELSLSPYLRTFGPCRPKPRGESGNGDMHD